MGCWCVHVDRSLLVYTVVGSSRCQWRTKSSRKSRTNKSRWHGQFSECKWKRRQYGLGCGAEEWEKGCDWTTLWYARRESCDDNENCARSSTNNEACALSRWEIGKNHFAQRILDRPIHLKSIHFTTRSQCLLKLALSNRIPWSKTCHIQVNWQ